MTTKELGENSEMHRLECELTEKELQQYGEDLAHRLIDISELIKERARINGKIKPIEQEVEQLCTKIDTKKEVREIVCDWHFDWDKGKKWLIRTDTYEVVPDNTYDITDFEKQQRLELDGQEP